MFEVATGRKATLEMNGFVPFNAFWSPSAQRLALIGLSQGEPAIKVRTHGRGFCEAQRRAAGAAARLCLGSHQPCLLPTLPSCSQ